METCPQCGYSPAVEATRMVTTAMNRYQNQTNKSISVINSSEKQLKAQNGDILIKLDENDEPVKIDEKKYGAPKENVSFIPATKEPPKEIVANIKSPVEVNKEAKQS